MIPAGHAMRSLLALKLYGNGRHSHVMSTVGRGSSAKRAAQRSGRAILRATAYARIPASFHGRSRSMALTSARPRAETDGNSERIRMHIGGFEGGQCYDP